MKVENSLAYFNLFNGERVSRKQISEECPNMIWAVDTMAQMGKLVGQFTFNPRGQVDLILWMAKKYPEIKFRGQTKYKIWQM